VAHLGGGGTTGDLLVSTSPTQRRSRDKIAKGSMDGGTLPTGWWIDLILARLNGDEAAPGFVLDGFPAR